LTAARQLAAAGLRVLILEARVRAGGRVHTLENSGWPRPIEAGAEFVHGSVPELDDQIRRAGLEAVEIEDRHVLGVDGRLEPLSFDAIWQPIVDRLKQREGSDVAFADFVPRCDLSPRDRTLVRSYVEGFNAADERLVSSQWLCRIEQDGGAAGGTVRRLLGPYSRIVDSLISDVRDLGVEMCHGVEAKAVRWRPGTVEIDTNRSETISASRAIVTVPLSLLSGGSPAFSPSLPDKERCWTSLKMGSVVKIVLRFEERLWPKDLVFLHTPDEPFETWWTSSPLEAPILTGWVGGPRSMKMSGIEPLAALERALATLRAALGSPPGHLEACLRDWHLFDWPCEPFARGAYMYVPVGEYDTPARLAEPIENTLFFAGEATEMSRAGTTGGAMASGTRVARQILAPGLRTQAL
jgi:monoamine oxidase